jgi:hypothetical protein
MSFINKSVNYSQIELLKTKVLKDILSEYNRHIYKMNSSKFNQQSFIVPNNNNKFYLLITHNSKINKTDNYNVLYFFPDKVSIDYMSQNKLQANKMSEFFVEIDYVFPFECLVEGYLYEADKSSNISNQSFLITDILSVKKQNHQNHFIVTSDFPVRYSLINELFLGLIPKISCLNNHLSISIHPVFEESYTKNNSIIKVFMKNFVFHSQLTCIETIFNFQKTRKIIDNHCVVENKIISKTDMSDVYTVRDVKSNNEQGILYVKTIGISQYLRTQFQKSRSLTLPCQFN